MVALRGVFPIVAMLVSLPSAAATPPSDPRTAEGQLLVCGGAEAWRAVGFLDFEVRETSDLGNHGPYRYRWDRRAGYLRLTGPAPDGQPADVLVELSSRSGGGSKAGRSVSGDELTRVVAWALQKFASDLIFVVFPLEWGASGVTVTPQADNVGDDGRTYPATRVVSPVGTWNVLLDPVTGRVARTVSERLGMPSVTVVWDNWQSHGGVLFAHRRTQVDTKETVEVSILQASGTAPADAF